jgi:type I restriction-modification system DNA methylase subunit
MQDANFLEKIKDHIRNRSYMSGVDREYSRVKATGEVFTPTTKVQHILDTLERLDPTVFKDPEKTFIDNSCGDGQILSEAFIRKVENGISFETALQTIYGVDLMPDNVELCRERLLCGQEHLRHIVEQNIVCADALRYHYRFDSSGPYEQESDRHFKNLFQIV